MVNSFVTNYEKMPCFSKDKEEILKIWQGSLLTKVGSGLAFFQLCGQTGGLEQEADFISPVWGQNLDKKFRAASTIKIPIVAALFYAAAQGHMELSDSVVISEADIVEGGILCEVGVGREFSWRELARLAIVISDNSASNLIIKKLGFKFINSFISNVLQVGQTVLRRYFVASPQEMGENYTSAQDLASIMALLWQGNILDKTYHEEFWAILSRQQFIEKLPSRIFSKVKNYNKTGELDDGARHDVAVFAHDNQVWGLVALTDQQEVPDWQIDLAMGAWSEQIFNLLTK